MDDCEPGRRVGSTGGLAQARFAFGHRTADQRQQQALGGSCWGTRGGMREPPLPSRSRGPPALRSFDDVPTIFGKTPSFQAEPALPRWQHPAPLVVDRGQTKEKLMREHSGAEGKNNNRNPTLRDHERAKGQSGEAVHKEKSSDRKPSRESTVRA